MNKGRREHKFNANTLISPTPHYPIVGGDGGITLIHALTKKQSPDYNKKREFHPKIKAINRIGPHNNDTCYAGQLYFIFIRKWKKTTKVEGCMLVVRETKNEYAQWLNTFFYNRGYTSNLQPIQYTRTLKST